MLAVGMVRGKSGVHTFELPVPEVRQPDEVLIRVKEVGLDGTDFNMVRYGLQDIAEGYSEMVMGHEMVGVVEAGLVEAVQVVEELAEKGAVVKKVKFQLIYIQRIVVFIMKSMVFVQEDAQKEFV